MDTPAQGHNGQLKALVERIENVNEQIKDLTEDRSEIFQEAKSNGYCVKTLRKVIAIRKKDPSARAEEEALLETYMSAIGDVA